MKLYKMRHKTIGTSRPRGSLQSGGIAHKWTSTFSSVQKSNFLNLHSKKVAFTSTSLIYKLNADLAITFF